MRGGGLHESAQFLQLAHSAESYAVGNTGEVSHGANRGGARRYRAVLSDSVLLLWASYGFWKVIASQSTCKNAEKTRETSIKEGRRDAMRGETRRRTKEGGLKHSLPAPPPQPALSGQLNSPHVLTPSSPTFISQAPSTGSLFLGKARGLDRKQKNKGLPTEPKAK